MSKATSIDWSFLRERDTARTVVDAFQPINARVLGGEMIAPANRKAALRPLLDAATGAIHRGLISLSTGTVLQLGYLRARDARLAIDLLSFRLGDTGAQTAIAPSPMFISLPAMTDAVAASGLPPREAIDDLPFAWLCALGLLQFVRGGDRTVDPVGFPMVLPFRGGLLLGQTQIWNIANADETTSDPAARPFYIDRAPTGARMIVCWIDQYRPAAPAVDVVRQALRQLLVEHGTTLSMSAQAMLLPQAWQDESIEGFALSPQSDALMGAVRLATQGAEYRAVVADAAARRPTMPTDGAPSIPDRWLH